MEIKGIGIDIEKISRFSKIKYEEKPSFYEKIFTDKEIKFCLKKPNPYQHFAVRFCAKEATIKALNSQKINLRDIEIRMRRKKPYLILPNNYSGLLSLSHTKDYAIAFVIIFK